MRHKRNRAIELETWEFQTRSNVVRTLFTNLLSSWQIITTPKRAFVLKAFADSFLSTLTRLHAQWARAEAIRRIKATVWTEKEWKKLLEDLASFSSDTSFIATYKLGMRKWDASEKILVKLI